MKQEIKELWWSYLNNDFIVFHANQSEKDAFLIDTWILG